MTRLVVTHCLVFACFCLAGCFASVNVEEGGVSGRVEVDYEDVVDEEEFDRQGLIQTGVASWYGGKFHGRKTASGEIYDKWDLTAAHRTLPLGSWLIVERISNGRRVKVKVNDRGPFVEGRIIDLSRGAASELDMVKAGVSRVRLYGASGPGQDGTTTKADLEPAGKFTIQVGSFTDESTARDLQVRLEDTFENVHVTFALGEYYRVRVGYYDSETRAESVASTLQSMGFDTWIVRESPDNVDA